MDLTLLHPVKHGSQEAQQDMLQLKLRDSLVRARVALINAVRFTLKSLGYPVSNPSSERFHKIVLKEVPESIGEMIAHNVAAIAELTQRIKALDISISKQLRTSKRAFQSHEQGADNRKPDVTAPAIFTRSTMANKHTKRTPASQPNAGRGRARREVRARPLGCGRNECGVGRNKWQAIITIQTKPKFASWLKTGAKAVRQGDMQGVLAHYADDVVIFEVPPPWQHRSDVTTLNIKCEKLRSVKAVM